MKEIPLTQGKFALVDNEDFEQLNQYKWYAIKKKNTFYAARNSSGKGGKKKKTIRMHREILHASKGKEVDHWNGDGLDNRKKVSIRLATRTQNNRNRGPNNNPTSSYFKGVHWDKRRQKWYVRIQRDGHGKFLGYFTDEIEAARAYNRAAVRYFGEFAKLNFLEEIK